VRCVRRAHIPPDELRPPEPEPAAEPTPEDRIKEAAIINPLGPDPDDLDDTDEEDPWGDDEPEFDPMASPPPRPSLGVTKLEPGPPALLNMSVAEGYPPNDAGSGNLGATLAAEPPPVEPDLPWTPPSVAEGSYERLTVAEAIERAPLAVWYYDGSKETLLNGVELIPRAQGLWVLNMGDGQGFRARPTDTILAVVFPSEPESTTVVVDSPPGDDTGSRRRSSQPVHHPTDPTPAAEPAPPKEKAVTTTTVRKGTNRASAAARTRKAAQRTPLPKRGDDKSAEMLSAIEEAVAEVTKKPTKRLPKKAKATPVEKIPAKVEKIERGDRDTAVNTEGRSKTSVKANAFMAKLRELNTGWTGITLSEFDGDAATVVAKRGDRERIEISWDGGVYVPGSGQYIRDGRPRILRNASDILKNWAPKSTAELEPKRQAPAPKGLTPQSPKKAAK
jgi:hypothetical protein